MTRTIVAYTLNAVLLFGALFATSVIAGLGRVDRGNADEATADIPVEASATVEEPEGEEEYIEVSLFDLIKAFKGVLRFVAPENPHTVELETASVDDKIDYIQGVLSKKESLAWVDLFKQCESRAELVCSFLAILELCRMGRIKAHQHRTFGDIRIFSAPESAPAE